MTETLSQELEARDSCFPHGGNMRIFLAGAAGAIGKRLVPLLLEAGYHVVGTTRSPSKAETLRAAGVEPVVVDAFNASALARAVALARPDVVVHQLTDLPPGLAPDRMAEGIRRTARMRSEGTRNLVAAALEAGVPRLIAQSIAWLYAPGPEPHSEDDPLDLHAADSRAITVGGVATLERLTLATPGIDGVVLRNGLLYGPNTGLTATPEPPSVHVDAVAYATVLAIDKGRGIYNVADPNGYLSTEKAQRELGFDAAFRMEGSGYDLEARRRTEKTTPGSAICR
jgi:nucleoside-diphosphate-sugar epimerase